MCAALLVGGVFPADVQALFDAAKDLERGRKGRCLADRIAPDLAGAGAAYAAALRALDAAGADGAPAAEWARVRACYVARADAVEKALAAAAAAPPRARLAAEAKTFRVFSYDAAAHDLVSATLRILEAPAGFGDLADAHELWSSPEADDPPPACPAALAALCRVRRVPRAWRRLAGRRREHIRAFRRTEAYAAFVASYRKFAQDVVAPIVGGPIAYQCPPTLRLHFPGTRPLGTVHRDSDYDGHTGDEINFWIPVTRAFESNSLHVESAPDAGDYAPVALQVGDLLRFDGERCRHHTVANATGRTRVSLDFRVIPRALYRDEFGGRIGAYPAELTT